MRVGLIDNQLAGQCSAGCRLFLGICPETHTEVWLYWVVTRETTRPYVLYLSPPYDSIGSSLVLPDLILSWDLQQSCSGFTVPKGKIGACWPTAKAAWTRKTFQLRDVTCANLANACESKLILYLRRTSGDEWLVFIGDHCQHHMQREAKSWIETQKLEHAGSGPMDV